MRDILQSGDVEVVSQNGAPKPFAIPTYYNRECGIDKADMLAVPYPDGNSRVTMRLTLGKDYKLDSKRDGAPQPFVLIGGQVYGLQETPYTVLKNEPPPDPACGPTADDKNHNVCTTFCQQNPKEATTCTYRFLAPTAAIRSAQRFLVRDITRDDSFVKAGTVKFAPSFGMLAILSAPPETKEPTITSSSKTQTKKTAPKPPAGKVVKPAADSQKPADNKTTKPTIYSLSAFDLPQVGFRCSEDEAAAKTAIAVQASNKAAAAAQAAAKADPAAKTAPDATNKAQAAAQAALVAQTKAEIAFEAKADAKAAIAAQAAATAEDAAAAAEEAKRATGVAQHAANDARQSAQKATAAAQAAARAARQAQITARPESAAKAAADFALAAAAAVKAAFAAQAAVEAALAPLAGSSASPGYCLKVFVGNEPKNDALQVQTANLATLSLDSDATQSSKAVRVQVVNRDPKDILLPVEWDLTLPKSETTPVTANPAFLRVGSSAQVVFSGGALATALGVVSVDYEQDCAVIFNPSDGFKAYKLTVRVPTCVTKLPGHKDFHANITGNDGKAADVVLGVEVFKE